MAASYALPQPVAKEILRRYADVLRVGRFEVNSEIVTWETGTSTELQLRSFCEVLFGKLRCLQELSPLDDEVIRLASYWVCKAVSINYALIEVLLLVQQRVGAMCTIETREERGGALVHYSLEACSSHRLRIKLSWDGKDNIVYRNPMTGEKVIKGTLSSLDTEFALPPPPTFAPAYYLKISFNKSLTSKFVSKVACRTSDHVPSCAIIAITDPLRSDYPMESEVKSTTSSTTADLTSTPEQWSLPPSSPDSSCLHIQPRCFTARSVKLCTTPSASASTASRLPKGTEVGQLRVHVLHAQGLAGLQETISFSLFSCSLADCLALPCGNLYCRCTLASCSLNTRPVSPSASIFWKEAFDFPLRAPDLRRELLVELFSDRVNVPIAFGRVAVSAVLSEFGKVAVTLALQQPKSDSIVGSLDLELELIGISSGHARDLSSSGSLLFTDDDEDEVVGVAADMEGSRMPIICSLPFIEW